MMCLRCGQCCKKLLAVVVIDPDLGIVESNLETVGITGEPCRHLRGNEPGDYSCAVHEYPWYKETPCYRFTQIEKSNSYCRTGLFTLGRHVPVD